MYDLEIEEYYSKIKCNFSRCNEKQNNYARVINIDQILKNYIQLTQHPVYTIREQLMNYYIKLFHKDANKIMGKISN